MQEWGQVMMPGWENVLGSAMEHGYVKETEPEKAAEKEQVREPKKVPETEQVRVPEMVRAWERVGPKLVLELEAGLDSGWAPE